LTLTAAVVPASPLKSNTLVIHSECCPTNAPRVAISPQSGIVAGHQSRRFVDCTNDGRDTHSDQDLQGQEHRSPRRGHQECRFGWRGHCDEKGVGGSELPRQGSDLPQLAQCSTMQY
jgi:hypothetical protein